MEVEKGTSFIIKYKGIFDMDRLYIVCRQWFEDKLMEFHEETYKYKVPSPLGSEYELAWKAWRKLDEYAKMWINVAWKLWEATEVEVMVDGKRKKMEKARVRIVIDWKIDLDYQNRFDSPFGRHINRFYLKFVYKKKLDNLVTDMAHYKALELQTLIKEELAMATRGNEFASVW
ncbi:hypothetical protein JXB02_04410 [Candidatus Woesearchaeota archaeon]|nr:hypothetical protein [Candidatus Woesearchaeota archaeon]